METPTTSWNWKHREPEQNLHASQQSLLPPNISITNASKPYQGISMPFHLEHAPSYLVVVALTSAIYLLLVFAIRLFLRLKVNGPFGKDDWACAISTAFGLIYSIIVVIQVGLGLGATGRQISPSHANNLAIIGWVNGFLLTFAGFFSKISGCFLLTRITKTREHLAVAYGLMAAMVIWMLQAQISSLVQCDFPRPWDSSAGNACNDRVSNAVSQ